MQELVREYLGELRGKQKKRRRVGMIVAAFAVIIVGGVIWGLIQSGIAMTGEPRCGLEEHTHSDACYTSTLVCGQGESGGHQHTDACYETQSTLVCGLEESEPTEESEGHVHGEECYATEQVLVCGQEESAGHTHTDGCYENQQTCGKEEHIHNDYCYIDTNADVEDAAAWDAQYKDVEWKEAWGEDLVTAAKAQVGYKESTKNYTVAEDGSHKGYTRYGQFVGDVYTDWDAPFVNFCMHYARLETSNLFPNEKVTAEWYDKFVQADENNQNYITAPEGYEPKAGDLIFFNKEGEETAFQMGVVSSYNNEKHEIEVIEGNSGNEVKENKYDAGDEHIASYLMISELEKAYKDNKEEKAPAEEAAPETPADEAVTEETPEETAEQAETPAYEEKYEDDTIVINVSAAEGVVPEGAELSVTPIEQKEVTREMSDEEAAEVEKVNEQYELTNQKLLEESEKKQETLEGFLAYDICFIVDGEEVEPSGDVKVTMDFKEATKPEGVSENATVAVNHLKEDENAADGIKVEDLTEKEDTTIATAEADASVEKVELVTDGFSTFVITWIYGNDDWEQVYSPKMQIEYVDPDKKPIPYNGDITFTINKDSVVNLEEKISNTIKVGDDYYKYDAVNVIKPETNEEHSVVSVKVQEREWGFAKVIFCDLAGNDYSYGAQEVEEGRVKLQLIYHKAGAILIEDDIVQSGNIKVEGGESILNQTEYQNKTFRYVWKKQINGMSYEEVQTIIYENKMTNISDDGKSLNIALDKGALNSERESVNYKVELQIYDNEGNKIYSVESDPFPVKYYSEVQNGGFENPPLIPDSSRFHWVSAEEVDGWHTTASNNEIEILCPVPGSNLVFPGINGYGENAIPAAEGKQFAEINGHEVHGALYQDVLTIKGIPLNYYFSHRARANAGVIPGTNKMYVVIMPTKAALVGGVNGGVIDTRAEVLSVVNGLEADSNNVEEGIYKDGIYVRLFTTRTEWVDYQDEYIPTDSLTRFFFVSAEEKDPTMGNYLDNVWFGQDIPVPSSNKFNLRIEKTVANLSSESLDELKNKLYFSIEVKDSEGNLVNDTTKTSNLLQGKVVTLKAKNMTWVPNADGTVTGTFDYTDNQIEGTYTISVVEKEEKLDGYTVTSTSENTVTSLGGSQVKTEGSTDIKVGSKQAVEVAFNNAYEVEQTEPDKVKDILFTKIWEDFNNEYEKRPETLQVKLVGSINGVSLTPTQLEELKVDVNSLTQTITGKSGWRHTWVNIPVYYGKDKTLINWSVEEMLTNEDAASYTQKLTEEPEEFASLLDNGDSDTEDKESEELFITNVLDNDELRDWRMVKHSSSSREKTLDGAMFELEKSSQSLLEVNKTNVIAKGESDSNGNIEWEPTDSSKNWETVKKELNGEYIIRETKAPVGYSLSNTAWKIEFVNGIPNINGNQNNIDKDKADGKIVFYIGNTALYALPDAGGSGVYWYMFSGILLMAGAALITYKKRCREVLRS